MICTVNPSAVRVDPEKVGRRPVSNVGVSPSACNEPPVNATSPSARPRREVVTVIVAVVFAASPVTVIRPESEMAALPPLVTTSQSYALSKLRTCTVNPSAVAACGSNSARSPPPLNAEPSTVAVPSA